MKRRDFLKTPGYFVAVASLAKMSSLGCGGDDGVSEGDFLFPQGVASGDPRTTSVVLWTRVEHAAGDKDDVDVTVQVSETSDFATLVVEEKVAVTAASDHTLRMVVTELSAASTYFYRFLVGLDESQVGRTLTAPADDADVPVRLAWVSCQDYSAGNFGAYRQLINDDEARREDEQIQFVVHLGDFIYETRASGFQNALDDNFEPIDIRDAQGNIRALEEFPSGGGNAGEDNFAQNVDDYRHLYKTSLTDPDLQAARARWPFITTWDDHEFTDDSWQSQANYTNETSLNEASQARKMDANQAWFEFMPVQLSGAVGVSGVQQAASDFTRAPVEDKAWAADEVDGDYQVTEANNQAAINSLTIYRSFRYGQNVELVITDERTYRSDHALPEEITQDNPLFFASRYVLPIEMVNTFDEGMTANGGNPPAEVNFFPNPRMQTPPGTVLGPQQKTWWKDTMKNSDATWKLWGNQVPIMRFLINNRVDGPLAFDRIMNTDAWDGYNTERKELMSYLRDEVIDNVVIITGDIHAQLCGLVMDDYDAATPQPVAAEFCAAGIASNSVFSFFEGATKPLIETLPEVRRLVTYDATAMGGGNFVENTNVLLVHGMASAEAAAATHNLTDILAAKDPAVNPHLRYVDTNAQGYGLLTITSAQVTAELVTINRPTTDTGTDGPGVKRTASFTIDKDNVAGLAEPTIEGTKPFPLDMA